jgi:hypothetical protein
LKLAGDPGAGENFSILAEAHYRLALTGPVGLSEAESTNGLTITNQNSLFSSAYMRKFIIAQGSAENSYFDEVPSTFFVSVGDTIELDATLEADSIVPVGTGTADAEFDETINVDPVVVASTPEPGHLCIAVQRASHPPQLQLSTKETSHAENRIFT